MVGKVVGIMGHTRSGKSHLAKLLGSHYGAPVLYEDGGGEFPERIRTDIRDGSRPLERFLFFRNISISMQLEAAHLTKQHPVVFTDAVWASGTPYIEAYGADDFEKEQLRNLCALDLATLPWPDVVIVLREDEETAYELWKKSSKVFETSPDYFETKLLPVKRAFDTFLSVLKIPVPSIVIDRSGLDFDTPKDLGALTNRIDAIRGNSTD